MDAKCKRCKNDVKENYIVCGGFCGEKCHRECARLSSEAEAAGSRWICTPCSSLLDNSSMKKIIVARESVIQFVRSEVEKGFKDVCHQVSENATQIHNNTAKIDEIITKMGKSNNPFTSNKRNRRELDEKPEHTILTGCKAGEDYGITSVPKTSFQSDLFWLYVTRIKPTVNENSISNMVQKCLETDSVTVFKIVPKSRIESGLPVNFVSFKIGISKDLKGKALNAATWPTGLNFREFVNYNSTIQDEQTSYNKRYAKQVLKPSNFTKNLTTPEGDLML